MSTTTSGVPSGNTTGNDIDVTHDIVFRDSRILALYHGLTLIWAILGVFGNSLTIYVISKFEDLQTTSNIIVLSLSVADLIGGIVRPPRLAADIISTYHEAWIYVCILTEFFIYLSACMNIITICLIAIDRSIYIHFPLKYHDVVTNKRVIIVIIISWIYTGLALLIAIFSSLSLYLDHRICVLSEISPTLYNTVMFPQFALLSALSLILYCKISYTAYKQSRQIQDAGMNAVEGESAQTRITRMMATIMGVYFLLNLPTTLSSFFLYPDNLVDYTLVHVFFIIFDINIWINPLIYGLKSKDMRKAYKKALNGKCL